VLDAARLRLMIETTAGSSLARATIVDEDGHILLDELVRQKIPILLATSRTTVRS
jgi:RNA exonuclease 1